MTDGNVQIKLRAASYLHVTRKLVRKPGMLGFTTLSEKHKPLKEIWSINLHQEAPRWLTTVVETDDGSVLTFCPKTRIWHSVRSLVWTNSAESLGWWGVPLVIIPIPCSKSRPATQRSLDHTQETSGGEGDKVTFHTCILPRELECGGENLSWKNSQLAGCSPNRRMSWSCVNLTKVSYCSGVERTRTHSYFWQFEFSKQWAPSSKLPLFQITKFKLDVSC